MNKSHSTRNNSPGVNDNLFSVRDFYFLPHDDDDDDNATPSKRAPFVSKPTE